MDAHRTYAIPPLPGQPTDPAAALVERVVIGEIPRFAYVSSDKEGFVYCREEYAHAVAEFLAGLRERAARAAIAAMREGDGWVACSERMPVGRVLVWSAPFERNGCRYLGAHWLGRYYEDEAQWSLPDDEVGSSHAVTHWRPLPKPPTDGGGVDDISNTRNQ